MKLVITGGAGAGTAAAAAYVGRKSGIPVYAGDDIAVGIASEDVPGESGRFRRSPEEEEEIIAAVFAQKSWIWEGARREEQDIFFAESDLIFLLDYPLPGRIMRILGTSLSALFSGRQTFCPQPLSKRLAHARQYNAVCAVPDEYLKKTVTVKNSRAFRRAWKKYGNQMK